MEKGGTIIPDDKLWEVHMLITHKQNYDGVQICTDFTNLDNYIEMAKKKCMFNSWHQ